MGTGGFARLNHFSKPSDTSASNGQENMYQPWFYHQEAFSYRLFYNQLMNLGAKTMRQASAPSVFSLVHSLYFRTKSHFWLNECMSNRAAKLGTKSGIQGSKHSRHGSYSIFKVIKDDPQISPQS